MADSSPQGATPDDLITAILGALGAITERFESNEREEWQWITRQSADPLVVEVMEDASATMLRVIDAIGQREPVNGITISEAFRIPKGTVSKVTRRLLARDLIRAEARPNNKKEILFRLTPLGQEIFRVHRAFDAQMERGFRRFLHRYTPEELALVARLLHAATEASFLTLGQATDVAE